MRLVLQRAIGDCGLAALATLIEQSYEDVYHEAAKVERRCRGKSGVYLPHVLKMAKALGVTLVTKARPNLDEDEGLLVVKWLPSSRNEPGTNHMVAVGHGVIIDPADGTILPADEYFAREHGKPRAFLEIR